MSTKTTFKRVALVAVASLGFFVAQQGGRFLTFLYPYLIRNAETRPSRGREPGSGLELTPKS